MKQRPKTKKAKPASAAGTKEEPKQCVKHIPEWNAVFRRLREEAEERHPDGRLRILLPEIPIDEKEVIVEDQEDDE